MQIMSCSKFLPIHRGSLLSSNVTNHDIYVLLNKQPHGRLREFYSSVHFLNHFIFSTTRSLLSAYPTRNKSAKALFTFASAIKIAAQQEEQKRNKALRDAEALIQKEQEKKSRASASEPLQAQRPAVNQQPTTN